MEVYCLPSQAFTILPGVYRIPVEGIGIFYFNNPLNPRSGGLLPRLNFLSTKLHGPPLGKFRKPFMDSTEIGKHRSIIGKNATEIDNHSSVI